MTQNILRELSDGIIIRRSTAQDAEALVDFNKEIHSEGEWDEKGLGDWTRDLISGEGPTFKSDDFTIVEDTHTGEIVSTCCLISQEWTYEGIPFKVGRPELVGTKKEYRRKGLVREQFDILHAWSSERGELAQVITGIPYYYRQFGYEMTLNLSGGRAGYEPHVPKLKEGEDEKYSFRLATEADIPFLMATYELGCQRGMIAAVWDTTLWKYELTGKRKYNINRREIYIIENQAGDRAGFIGTPPIKWGQTSALTIYELKPEFSWTEVTPSVIRFLWKKGEHLAKEQNQQQNSFSFWLGETHPVYEVIASKLPQKKDPYSYYVRVQDMSAFLQKIQPALEKRLVESAFRCYSGEIKLGFYRNGLSLIFDRGQLDSVKSLEFSELESCSAHFPPFVFLQLLFGHRTMGELEYAFTDVSAKDRETTHLLNTLFPKKPSEIWPIA